MTFVAWLTGLPGSGKTSIAGELQELFKDTDVKISFISLDDIRRRLVPAPKYTPEERELVYRALLLCAKLLYDAEVIVVLDATAHRREWRNLARSEIKNFVEIYVKCPVEQCIIRETMRKEDAVRQKIYADALDRLKTGRQHTGLGQVPGVDVAYEEPETPEIIVETDRLTPEESALRIMERLKQLFPETLQK